MDPEQTTPTAGAEGNTSAPEPRTPDTYTTTEAAKLLSRDPSQVRQWIRNGRLAAVSTHPQYLITQESVHRLREQLRKTGAAARANSAAPAADGVDVESLVRSIVNEVLPRALEAQSAASDKVERLYQEQLAAERDRAERAERVAAEAKADAERRIVEQTEKLRAEHAAELERAEAARRAAEEAAVARRGWFGGRRGSGA
ncbi:MAG TPA: helix-turn-helix domain-containing protein [Pseudonocardia sp.]